MTKNLLEKLFYILILTFINIILYTTGVNAFEGTSETTNISVTNVNLLNNTTETFNVSTKTSTNTMETYMPETSRNISIHNSSALSPYAIIGDTDDRSLVTNTRQYPYSSICFVYTKFSDNYIGYRNSIHD